MHGTLLTILAELRGRFEVLYGSRLLHLILYGSQARDDATPDSGIDILVELQSFHCSTPRCCQTNDKLETFVPGKMILPLLRARMKQLNKLISNGIARLYLIVFVIVASLACQCEIVE